MNKNIERRERVIGKVKLWNNERKFGFIEQFHGGEYFVHISQINGASELIRGSIVEFEIGYNKRNPEKPVAENVLVVETPEK